MGGDQPAYNGSNQNNVTEPCELVHFRSYFSNPNRFIQEQTPLVILQTPSPVTNKVTLIVEIITEIRIK